eukprot:sb/3477544/
MLTCPYTEAGQCKPAHDKLKEGVSKTQGLFLSSNLYYLQQTCPILIRSTLTLILHYSAFPSLAIESPWPISSKPQIRLVDATQRMCIFSQYNVHTTAGDPAAAAGCS